MDVLVTPENISTATNQPAMFGMANHADFLWIPLIEERRFLRQDCYFFEQIAEWFLPWQLKSCYLLIHILCVYHLFFLTIAKITIRNPIQTLFFLILFGELTGKRTNVHTLVIAFVEVSSPDCSSVRSTRVYLNPLTFYNVHCCILLK